MTDSTIKSIGLIKYRQKAIAERYGLATVQCLVTESHFYRGRFRAMDAKRAGKLESDRIFEDRLIENDVIFHYKHIRQMEEKVTFHIDLNSITAANPELKQHIRQAANR